MSQCPDITFSPISETDKEPVIDLFNYYIENSFAAYPEEKVPYEFFCLLLETCRHYPSVAARQADGTLVGFGLLRAHNPMQAFRHTAEITCFIHPDLTGKGIGTRMLELLENAGKAKGITTILASISSLNDGSIRFHGTHGFRECGRFVRVGMKKGTVFDTVWLQKFL
ncbi:MAG: N-acetyltransferase [Methanomicrobiales archaeon]|nr:N-acetyltransferase [Methanomicrobiales archaeon]